MRPPRGRRARRTRLKRPNPFIGPRAFKRTDRLYGRDEERRELTDLLIAERVVLLHSPSGAGKTSLIQAGVMPALEDAEGFRTTGPLRVNAAPAPGVGNRYVRSAVLGLLPPSLCETPPPLDMTLVDAVARREELLDLRDGRTPGERWDHVLIFDQFEEVLSLDPTDWDGQEEFFRQVGAVLEESHRWALFSMREDYMGGLNRFRRQVPTHLRTQFRLDFLERETQAIEAMQRSALCGGVEFERKAAEHLAEELATIKVQVPCREPEPIVGPYVEPVHLQVVCHKLWQRVAADAGDDFDRIDLDQVKRYHDLENVLGGFYADALADLAARAKVDERVIRDWFDDELITEQGYRGQTMTGPQVATSVDVLGLLEGKYHLIRGDTRGSTTWYELAHDRLVNPVRANNVAWRRLNLNPWEYGADEWKRSGEKEHHLLRPAELRPAGRWLAQKGADATEVELAFLEASRKASKQRSLIRRFSVAVTFLAAVASAEFAVILYLLLR